MSYQARRTPVVSVGTAECKLSRRQPFWLCRNHELFFLMASAAAIVILAAVAAVQEFGLDWEKAFPLPPHCAFWFLDIGGLLGGFLLTHTALRFCRFSGSQMILPLVQTLAGVGCVLLSVFAGTHPEQPIYPQSVEGALLGCILLTAGALATRIDTVTSHKYSLAAGAIGLSLALVFFGSGPKGTDTRINLLGLFQPAELIKLMAVLFFAGYFADRDTELQRFCSFQFAGVSVPRLRDALPVLLVLTATLGLFFIERDLGPASVVYLIFLGMATAASKRLFYGMGGLAALIAVFVGIYRTGWLATVSTRIDMWLSPWDNHRPGGLQLAQSLWALAAGGSFGSGFQSSGVHSIPAGHTDLILASAGETLGFAGLAAILLLLAALAFISLRVAERCRSTSAAYVALGAALLIGVQTAIIAGATVGLLPLTGIPVPFLSYGKSATIVQFLLMGIVLNASALPRDGRRRGFGMAASLTLLVAVLGIVGAAARVMLLNPGLISARSALVPQADGVRRFAVNPRLLAIAARIPRGRILDRNGSTLAADGVAGREYTLGADTFHVIGRSDGRWSPAGSIEKRFDPKLRGYRLPETVQLVDGRPTLMRDYSALAALHSPSKLASVQRLDRDVRLTLDARYQSEAARALRENMPVIRGEQRTRGAAIVLRARSGELLASVSLPGVDPSLTASEPEGSVSVADKPALDRARSEIYAPGSTFKTILAGIALEDGLSDFTIACHHKQPVEWRWGGREHRRTVTDDGKESPHGLVGLQDGFRESCNVYFASLGVALGAQRIYDTAKQRLHMSLKHVSGAQDLEPNLPDNSYGQAKATVTPLEMAEVAASVINGGWYMAPILEGPAAAPERVWRPDTAAALAAMMLSVVQSGTGGAARVSGAVVGGKTGTAQNQGQDSHSWFIGYAYPEGGAPDDALAFAFLIENGGYGGGPAAHAAGQFLKTIYGK